MRIIGGAYRGKKLYSPEYEGVRPTSDRAREAVFNILSSKLAGDWAACDMLDVLPVPRRRFGGFVARRAFGNPA